MLACIYVCVCVCRVSKISDLIDLKGTLLFQLLLSLGVRVNEVVWYLVT